MIKPQHNIFSRFAALMIIMIMSVGTAWGQAPISLDNFGTSGWNSSYDSNTKTITFNETWTGRGWWLVNANEESTNFSYYSKIEVTYSGTISARLVINYDDEDDTSEAVTPTNGSATITLDLDKEKKNKVKQIYIQNTSEAGSIVLNSVTLTPVTVSSAEFQLPATKTIAVGEGYSQNVVVKVTLSDDSEHDVETTRTYWQFADNTIANQVTGTRIIAGYKPGTTTFTIGKYGDSNGNWTFNIDGKGTFTIPASSVTSQTTTITVTDPTRSFNYPATLTMTAGGVTKLSAGLTYPNDSEGTPKSQTISASDLTVTSSNTGVATVGSDGQVSAIAAGTSTITVQLPAAVTRTFGSVTQDFDLSAYSYTIALTVNAAAAELTPVTETTTWNFEPKFDYHEVIKTTIMHNLQLITPTGEPLGYNYRGINNNKENFNSYTIKSGTPQSGNIPARGFAFKVTGKGTISIVGNANTREFCLIAANGATDNVTGSNTVNLNYERDEATTLYVYPTDNSGTQFYSITWTPTAKPITTVTEGSNTISQVANDNRFIVSVPSASAGKAVALTVTKGSDNYALYLSKGMTAAELSNLSDEEKSYALVSGNPATFNVTAPAAGKTSYYNVRVTGAGRAGDDDYVFEVRTAAVTGTGLTYFSGTGVPAGWKLVGYDIVNGAETSTIGETRVPGGNYSLGPRLMTGFPSSGVTTAGVYFCERDAKQWHFRSIGTDDSPSINLPTSGRVKVTVLATGWQSADHKFTYQVYDASNAKKAEVKDIKLSSYVDNGVAITADKIHRASVVFNATAGNHYIDMFGTTGNLSGVLVLGYEIEYLGETESNSDLATTTENMTWIASDENYGALGLEDGNELWGYMFKDNRVYVNRSQYKPGNRKESMKMAIDGYDAYPVVNSKLGGNRYVSVKVNANAKVVAYGYDGGNKSTNLAIQTTSSALTANYENTNTDNEKKVSYKATADGTVLYIGGRNSGTSDGSDIPLAGIQVLYPAAPEYTCGFGSYLDIPVGTEYRLSDVLNIPYDPLWEEGYTLVGKPSGWVFTRKADGLYVTATTAGRHQVAVYYEVNGTGYQSQYFYLQGRSTAISALTLNGSDNLVSSFSGNTLEHNLGESFSGNTTTISITPVGDKIGDGFSMSLLNGSTEIALTKADGVYTATVPVPSRLTLTVKDGIDTEGGRWGEEYQQEYTIKVISNDLGVVDRHSIWDGDSWKEINTTSSGDAYVQNIFFKDKDKALLGNSLKVYAIVEKDKDGKDQNKSVTVYADRLLFAGGRGGTFSSAPVSPTRGVLEFKAIGSGTIKVLGTNASGNILVVAHEWKKNGVLTFEEVGNWDQSGTPADVTEITVNGNANEEQRVFVYANSNGFTIRSIEWTPIEDDKVSTFNVESNSTAFTTTVGAKWEKKITITNASNEKITTLGTFTVSGTNKISVEIDETENCAYIVGEETGTGLRPTITWKSHDGSYTNATKSFTGTVDMGTLTMAFSPTSGEVVKGRSIAPPVKFTRSDGKEATGLNATYTSATTAVATSDGTTVTGVKVGSSVISASFAGDDNYNAIPAASINYTLTVIGNTPATATDRKDDEDRLVMIAYTPDYYSPNMADYLWYDEAGGDDNVRDEASVPMSRLHSYLSADNRFRVYSAANDEVFDNAKQKGVMLKDSRSWIEFYAQGTATLTVKGYATTPRVLELYAVNDVEYDGNTLRDPDLSKAKKVDELVVSQAGPFSIFRLVSQPAKNYFFLKTSVGGIYVSEIDWTNSLLKPYITIKNVGGKDENGLAAQTSNTFNYNGETKTFLNSKYIDSNNEKGECHYALDHTTGHMRVIETERLEIKAWTYTGEDGTRTQVDIAVPEWPTTDGRAKLTFASSDETVAKVDSTGLVIPMSQGVCKIYVYLNAGSVTSGNTTYTYGAQRAELWLHILDEAVDVDFVDDAGSANPRVIEEVLYSPHTSTSMSWPEVFVTEYGNWTAVDKDYTLSYHILDEYGKTLSDDIAQYISIAKNANDNGYSVTISDSEAAQTALDGKKFRVAVEMTSEHYVDQRAYFILNYTKGLTIPTVQFHGTGMKELSDARGIKSKGIYYYFAKAREYFARAEEQVTLTFTIPETTTGMTTYYKICTDDNLPTTADINWETFKDAKPTGNTFTVTVPSGKAIDNYGRRYVCVHMVKGEGSAKVEWDGLYMITFFKMPTCAVSGSATKQTATITSKNASFNNTSNAINYSTYDTKGSGDAVLHAATPLELHYTTDTSDPMADDERTAGSIIFETNTVLRYVEVFVAPEGLTLTDEYGSASTTFSTGIPADVKIAVTDNTVFYTGDYANNSANLPTEAYVFNIGSDEATYDPVTNYNVKYLPKTATTFADAEMTVMFGTRNAPIYRNNQFLYGGHTLGKSPAPDSGIKSYIDIYDSFVKSSDAAKESNKPSETEGESISSYTPTGNPSTEWNQLIGGIIHDRRPQGSLYLTPMSGDFIRFEPEYNGIVSVWMRSNGSTASNATTNVENIDKYFKSHSSVDNNNLTLSKQGVSKTIKVGELKRIIKNMEQADLTRRPVYIMDENGKIMQRNTAAYSYDSYADINGVVADISMQSKFGTDLDHAWGYNHKYYYNNRAELDELIELATVSSVNGTKIDSVGIDSFYYKTIVNYKKALNGDPGANNSRNFIDDMQFYADKYAFDLESTVADQYYPITEVIYCDNAYETREQFAKYGFELPNSNYVRYRFPVTAGKTYYIAGRGTKNYFSAMKFEKDDACDELPTNILDGTTSTKTTVQTTHAWMSAAKGTQMNVAVKREFKKDMWHPIVLPFSVSESRMRQIFGTHVRVLMLDEAFNYSYKNPTAVQGTKLTFTRHYYQMLYANVPAYVCPSKDVTMNYKSSSTLTENDCVLFERVTYEGNTIRKQDIGSGFTWTGSYTPEENTNIDMYYLSNKSNSDSEYKSADGTAPADYVAKLYHAKDGQKMLATRCWIQAPTVIGGSSSQAPPLTRVGIGNFDATGQNENGNYGIEIDITRGDDDIESLALPTVIDPNVYNLQGIVVGTKDDIDHLPTGIYIYNKEKLYIKR